MRPVRARSPDRGKESVIRIVGIIVSIMLGTALTTGEAQVRNDRNSQIRLAAFTERPAETGKPILLHVYIINESPTALTIFNDLDSLNVPEHPLRDGETVQSADLVHIDFGTSGSGAFLGVRPGECVRVSLILREEQLAMLDRVRYIETTVKFREGIDEKAEAKTVLLPALVYKTL